MLKTYIFLLIAIVFEIIATSALKASDQFSKLWPSILTVCGYAAAFYFLSLSLNKLNLGIAYAIWSGIGIVMISFVGLFLFKQKLDFPAIIGIALIVCGVVVINVFSKAVSH
ncbi:SMR family transporter [Pedobacter nyackensis]|uniref:Small multidrug resistance pump n=1 Tax=Pedobacter nyackensis TaxID=475255 RepID=A0A1W2E0C8_9SPHI|nr:SMR family transporter [Pedobacter nyackensis]SMD03189.1 small multidrug resistance pump [Pedobacter nyackensis]